MWEKTQTAGLSKTGKELAWQHITYIFERWKNGESCQYSRSSKTNHFPMMPRGASPKPQLQFHTRAPDKTICFDLMLALWCSGFDSRDRRTRRQAGFQPRQHAAAPPCVSAPLSTICQTDAKRCAGALLPHNKANKGTAGHLHLHGSAPAGPLLSCRYLPPPEDYPPIPSRCCCCRGATAPRMRDAASSPPSIALWMFCCELPPK
jgi:hypothetical protein